MAVKLISFLVASTLLLQLVASASLKAKNKECMCYMNMYDCDIDCVSDFETEYQIHECLAVCVRDYVNCRQRCNGESYNFKFSNGFKRSLVARR